MTIAWGYKFNSTTNDWSELVIYEGPDDMDAIRWCNFNREWLKHLQFRAI